MTVLNADAGATERVNRPDSWRADFIKRNGFRCHYCNRGGAVDLGPDDRPWHVDHMHPVSRGGPDEDGNLALACKRCNLTKGALLYEQFREFARQAFWVPDDWRLAEGVLDSLMNGYARWGDRYVLDRRWRLNRSAGAVCIYNVDQEFAPLLQLGGGYTDYLDVLQLVVDMYETLPSLIAEIRMHRAAERGEAA